MPAASEFWEINVIGWAIESAQILIILTEIPSWPCALLTSKALMSFITSLLQKQRVLIRSFVIYNIFAGKILLRGSGEHCFAKLESKTLAFSWKSVTNLLLINNGGITGTFLPLHKVFSIDQYVLLFSEGSFNFALRSW